MKLLSKEQFEIIQICSDFEKYLPDITAPKDSNDRPTINGIFFEQYRAIHRYTFFHPNDEDSSEIYAIKLIFYMNFNQHIPEDLIPEILKMVKTWEETNAFDDILI